MPPGWLARLLGFLLAGGPGLGWLELMVTLKVTLEVTLKGTLTFPERYKKITLNITDKVTLKGALFKNYVEIYP